MFPCSEQETKLPCSEGLAAGHPVMLSARCRTLSRAGRLSGMQRSARAVGKFRHMLVYNVRWSLSLETGLFQPGTGWVRCTPCGAGGNGAAKLEGYGNGSSNSCLTEMVKSRNVVQMVSRGRVPQAKLAHYFGKKGNWKGKIKDVSYRGHTKATQELSDRRNSVPSVFVPFVERAVPQ